jgi:hypothetical protein
MHSYNLEINFVTQGTIIITMEMTLPLSDTTGTVTIWRVSAELPPSEVVPQPVTTQFPVVSAIGLGSLTAATFLK